MHQETLKSIIIIDGSPDKLELMSCSMRQAGYQVITAEDGPAGLAIAKHHSPEFIVIDVSMPGIDGVELCRHSDAHESALTIPTILLSAISPPSNNSN